MNFEFTLSEIEQKEPVVKQGAPAVEVRAGATCSACCQGTLDYDGLLNLVCPVCGWTAAGCFT